MSPALDVAPERARAIIRGFFNVSESVSAEEIEQVRGQLPQKMKTLVPARPFRPAAAARSPSRQPKA